MHVSRRLPVAFGGAAAAALVALASTPAAPFEVLRARSSQGVEAWLVETPELPVIALHFAFRDAG
jgi:hypothetical protein